MVSCLGSPAARQRGDEKAALGKRLAQHTDNLDSSPPQAPMFLSNELKEGFRQGPELPFAVQVVLFLIKPPSPHFRPQN